MGKGRPQRQTVKEIRTPSGVTSPAKGAVASNRRQVMSGLRHLRAPKVGEPFVCKGEKNGWSIEKGFFCIVLGDTYTLTIQQGKPEPSIN